MPDRIQQEPAALLEAVGLVRRYSGQHVVDVERLDVLRGEVLALLGPNGAGKSTLLRLLAALEPPDAGRVIFKGREVRRDDPELRRAAVAVLQRPYLWRGTVAQNVEYGLKVRGTPSNERQRRAREALETLHISHLESAPVNTLSGGEAQRVALARALALEPEVLFLDEPTADLDVTVRRTLLADLEQIVRHAAPALVLVTHDPGEAFALADRLAVMEAGRVVQVGSPAEIFESPVTQFVASFTGAEFVLDGRVEREEEGTLRIRLDSGHSLAAVGRADAGARVRVAYRPEDVILGPPTTPATSARNRFPVGVARLHPQGGLVRLRLEGDGLRLEAVITRHALEDLEIAVGTRLVAQIKATAFHVFPV